MEPPKATESPAPTNDVQATVEAGIAATRQADQSLEATITARVEATKDAEPTSTPNPTVTPTMQPTPTVTPQPTPTLTPEPQPTARLFPTPGPVAGEYETKEVAGSLFDCLQVNHRYKHVFEQSAAFGVTAEGATQAGAEEIVRLLLSSREVFQLSYKEAIAQDTITLELLRLELQACETTIADQIQVSAETDTLAGQLFDCLQVNHGYRQVFEQAAAFGAITEGATQDEAGAVVQFMLSSKEFFQLSYKEAIAQHKLTPDLLRLELQACETTTTDQQQASQETDIAAGRLYDCLQVNQRYRQFFDQGAVVVLTTEGLTQEEAGYFLEYMMSDKETFLVAYSEAVGFNSPTGDLLLEATEQCDATLSESTPTVYDVETAAGRLFDCQQLNQPFRQLLSESLESMSREGGISNEELMAFQSLMFSSKDAFIEIWALVEADPSATELSSMLLTMLELCERSP